MVAAVIGALWGSSRHLHTGPTNATSMLVLAGVIAGLLAGLVSTHFTFKFLPFKAYTEPLITEELLHGLAFSLFIFTSLALVKRYSELELMSALEEAGARGRAYRVEDIDALGQRLMDHALAG